MIASPRLRFPLMAVSWACAMSGCSEAFVQPPGTPEALGDCGSCHGQRSTDEGYAAIERDIIDTHFDNLTLRPDGSVISDETSTYDGYILDESLPWAPSGQGYVTRDDPNVCGASCHDGHEMAGDPILDQWATSGHSHAEATAFSFPFEAVIGGFGKNTVQCLRCHSGAGFANYVADGNQIYPLWTGPTRDAHGHIITCNACHDGSAYPTEDDPRLRIEGEVTLVSGEIPDDGSASYIGPDAIIDAGRSAACVSCHQGRESGASVQRRMAQFDALGTTDQAVNPCDDDNDQFGCPPGIRGGLCVGGSQDGNACVTSDGTETSTAACIGGGGSCDLCEAAFINPHYFTAAATLYSQKGYELRDETYYPGNALHQGARCLGCHGAENENVNLGGHSFRQFHEGQENIESCVGCHGPIDSFDAVGRRRDMDGDGMAESIRDEITGLLEVVRDALAAQDIYLRSEHPYWFTTKAPAPQGSDDPVVTWRENQMIAAFNLKMIQGDPGAWVHNYRYAVQLLRDSYENLTGGVAPLAGIRPETTDDRTSVTGVLCTP